MKISLVFVFVGLVSFFFGSLIGFSNSEKLIIQRNKITKVAEEFKDLLDKSEYQTIQCAYQLTTIKSQAVFCCEAADKLLTELKTCKGKK